MAALRAIYLGDKLLRLKSAKQREKKVQKIRMPNLVPEGIIIQKNEYLT